MATCLITVSIPFTVTASQNTWDPDNGVYDISTEADLLAFRDCLNDASNNNDYYFEGATVNLLQDITMTQNYICPDSNGDAGAQFCGTFDGHNHTINNITMVASDGFCTGLFPFLGNATIKDLTLENVTIDSAYTWTAPFAPVSLGDDSIINCHLEGDCVIMAGSDFSKNWNYTAGMIADNYMGSLTIQNCTVGEDVVINGRGGSGKYRVAGGMLAYARKSTTTLVKNCVNRATISSDYIGSGIVGSFISSGSVDNMNYGAIIDCYNYGDVSSNPETTGTINEYAGILAESSNYSSVVINRCGNYGDITVSTNSACGSGGVAAEVNSAAIVNCFNTGNITAVSSSNLGGIVGHTRTNTYGSPIQGSVDEGDFYYPQQYNSITNCYNVGTVTTTGGDANDGPTGGIVGICQESETQAGNSEVVNVYNFGAVSANEARYGAVTADTDIKFENAFAADGTKAITYLHNSYGNASPYTCTAGYYSSPSKGGTVYPATVVSGEPVGSDVGDAVEVVSATPLETDLKETLDAFVDEVNPEFEQQSGQTFTLLPWTYSDGSDGLAIHPVFGCDVNVLTAEADKDTNGGYVTSSDYDVEYEKIAGGETITLTVHPNDNAALNELTVVDSDNNPITVTQGENANEYTFVMPESDVTVSATFTVEDTPYNGYYMTVEDTMELDFLVDMEYYGAAYLSYEYIDTIYVESAERGPKLVPVTDLEKHTSTDPSTDPYYGTSVLPLEAAPAQIGEKYKVTVLDENEDPIKDEGGNDVVFFLSIESYCKDYINYFNQLDDDDKTDESRAYAKLCETILNYGQLANEYFEYEAKHMEINSGEAYSITKVGTAEELKTSETTFAKYNDPFTSAELSDLNTNAFLSLDQQGKAQIIGVTYIAQLWPEFRFYLGNVTELEARRMNVSVTGGLNAQIIKVDDQLCVSVTGLYANDFGKTFTVTVGDTVITYNGYAYILSVTNHSSTHPKNEELKAMMRGVYRYAKAAEAAFDD